MLSVTANLMRCNTGLDEEVNKPQDYPLSEARSSINQWNNSLRSHTSQCLCRSGCEDCVQVLNPCQQCQGLSTICLLLCLRSVVVGASCEKLQEVCQAVNCLEHVFLEPEVLYVLAPPFVSRPQAEREVVRSHGRGHRSLLRKKRKRSSSSTATPVQARHNHAGEDAANGRKGSEDVTVPKDIDLTALPVPMMVPKTTSETLKHKINPSLDLAEPQTVHMLLYTPGQLTCDDSKDEMNPKLWVGLSGGRVVVFDAASCSMLQDSIHLGESQLELQAHSDSIQTLCSVEDRYVLSGSARHDGKIAIWKIELDTEWRIEWMNERQNNLRIQARHCSLHYPPLFLMISLVLHLLIWMSRN
ncbi:uncharacterized protein LOC133479429 [Phyllopteryx taeniolatus]|uniref:uncharacterized protein LOC133479429 n=1 Tax=Phyllopteryx taeniolatus TaxID=161469 RepID=UPI002AD30D2D|nr:uncharacterized protein LOC133479429 [Phyllopteryx taeniolatus]